MDPSGFSGNDLPAADRLLSSWLGRLGRASNIIFPFPFVTKAKLNKKCNELKNAPGIAIFYETNQGLSQPSDAWNTTARQQNTSNPNSRRQQILNMKT